MLKTKTITTDKATLLVLELDKFTDVDCLIEIHGNKLVSSQSKGLVINTTKLPEGNWQLLGRLPDITEEQADNIVEEASIRPIVSLITGRELGGWYNPDGYKDYTETNISLNTCLQSLHSLLQANEIYFENRKPWKKDVLQRTIDNMLDKEAQSKVFDKERTYLFIKVD